MYGCRSNTKGSGFGFLEFVRLAFALGGALVVGVEDDRDDDPGVDVDVEELGVVRVLVGTFTVNSTSRASVFTADFEDAAASRMKLSQIAFPTKHRIRGRFSTIFRRRAGTPAVNSVSASSAACVSESVSE